MKNTIIKTLSIQNEKTFTIFLVKKKHRLEIKTV